MHKGKRGAIVRDLIEVVENVSDPYGRLPRPSHTFLGEGPPFALSGAALEKFASVVRRLVQEEHWSDKFSEKYVFKKLGDLVKKALEDGHTERLGQYFDELVEEFNEFNEEQVVYIPVAGIELRVSSLDIGNVSLVRMTDERVDRFVDVMAARWRASVEEGEDAEEGMETIEEHVGILRGAVCVEFRVVAEPKRAEERAEEEARRVLDLIRYCIVTFYPPGYRTAVGLQGEAEHGVRLSAVMSSSGSLFWNSKAVGPVMPFEVTDKMREAMTEIGVFEVSAVLKKKAQELSEFEKVLLRAIHWLSNSQIQVEPENELLSLVTCLEAILTPKNRDPIGAAIAEGVAILLGSELEGRKRLKRLVRDLYGRRSAVSHGGRQVVLETDLATLRAIASSVTRKLIARKDDFQSKDQLLEWIEDQKLGG